MTQSYHSNDLTLSGTVHIVGIGGIGMSGIAELLHRLDYTVQGSDIVQNVHVIRLQDMGIPVFFHQKADNIKYVDILVISSAISVDNPEVIEARMRGIPIMRRSEMLKKLMRSKYSVTIAGTHGKTTTTSMIACVLDKANLDATIICGGIINAYDSNVRLGKGDYTVIEVDESDETFIHVPSTIAIVTNIDREHLNYYGSFDALKNAFCQYVENIPSDGVAIMCIDNDNVQNLVESMQNKKIISYGLSPHACIRAMNVKICDRVTYFDVMINDHPVFQNHVLKNCSLPMVGEYNVQNALATIAVGLEINISEQVIIEGLSHFEGVQRRFTYVDSFQNVDIYDDYAHHPTEISAVLEAAHAVTHNRVIAVIQPHRYTRLRDFFDAFVMCFQDVYKVMVMPVYAAGEDVIEGFDAPDLVQEIQKYGNSNVVMLHNPADLPRLIFKNMQAGDLVLFMGAGDITRWAYDLPHQLNEVHS